MVRIYTTILTGLTVLTFLGCGSENETPQEVAEMEEMVDVNEAPSSFTLISIANGSVDVLPRPTFTWNESTDPEGGPVIYDFYLDTSMNPNTLISSAISETILTLADELESEETYYWRVVARDNSGNSVESGVFSFTTIDVFSKTIDVVTGVMSPAGLAVKDNMLYIAEVEGNKISTIDLDLANPTLTDVITGILTFRLAFLGDELYISQPQGNLISKTDVSLGMRNNTLVRQGTNGPSGLTFSGNDLYVAASDVNQIVRLDITMDTPDIVNVVNTGGNSRPNGILLDGSTLYITMRVGNKVSEIDISDSTPTLVDVATGLSGPASLALFGNDLYIAEYSANKISRVDITSGSTDTTDFLTNLEGPRGLIIVDDVLYISEYDGNKISRITLRE